MRLAVGALILLGVATTAAAQAPRAEPEAAVPEAVVRAEVDPEARPRFELAVTLYEQGRYREAAEELERVWVLTEEPAVLYNAYLAWRNAGRADRAAQALRSYLEREPEVPERAVLEQQLRELEAAPVTVEPAATRSPDVTAPIATLATGGGLLLAAAVTGAVALALRGDLDAQCVASACPASSGGTLDALWATSVITDVSWISGAVIAAIGAVWLALRLGEGESSEVRAACGPDGCAIGARGSW